MWDACCSAKPFLLCHCSLPVFSTPFGLDQAGNKLTNLSKKEIEVVEKLSKGIVNKMLHGPMTALRQPDGPEEKKRMLKFLKAMFKLDIDKL